MILLLKMIPSPTHDDNTFLQKKIIESFGLSFQQDDKTEQKISTPNPRFISGQGGVLCPMTALIAPQLVTY